MKSEKPEASPQAFPKKMIGGLIIGGLTVFGLVLISQWAEHRQSNLPPASIPQPPVPVTTPAVTEAPTASNAAAPPAEAPAPTAPQPDAPPSTAQSSPTPSLNDDATATVVARHTQQVVTPLDRLLTPGAQPRLDAALAHRVQRLDNAYDIQRARSVLLDQTEDPAIRNELMDLFRRSVHLPLVDDLQAIALDAGESELMRLYAVQQLGVTMQDERFAARQHDMNTFLRNQYQTHNSTLVRREAFVFLLEGQDPVVMTDVSGEEVFSQERLQGMIDLAIHAAQKIDNKAVLPQVRALVFEPDEIVAVAAIAALGAWQDRDSLPLLHRMLNSPSLRLRRAARVAIDRM